MANSRLPSPTPWMVLAVGTVAVSTSAPLIKALIATAAMPAVAIAVWRTVGT